MKTIEDVQNLIHPNSPIPCTVEYVQITARDLEWYWELISEEYSYNLPGKNGISYGYRYLYPHKEGDLGYIWLPLSIGKMMYEEQKKNEK